MGMGLGGLGSRLQLDAMATGQKNKDGRQAKAERMLCLIAPLLGSMGGARAETHTPNVLCKDFIFQKNPFPKKAEGSQVQLCVRPAALANVGPPCENMQLRVRIQGEALQRPLRHCIELASLRTGLGDTSGQHSVTHELTHWITLQGNPKS